MTEILCWVIGYFFIGVLAMGLAAVCIWLMTDTD
jgi:hypothetical protein